MTARIDPIEPEGTLAKLRRMPLRPAEGWITVGLVGLLAVVLGWALDEPRWIQGADALTDFLPWAALGGVAVGVFGAKAGWSRWLAHSAGAVAAALVLPLVVGSILLEGWALPGDLYRATADSVAAAWIDLAILQRTVTYEVGHYALALGILAWGSGQFAAFAVFGHRRPLDAVIVLGLVLLVNMSLTSLDQLRHLILFSLAGLLLLARCHAFEEQATWVRRRIGDPSAVRALYLRGGTVFLVAAVVGSLALTASAASAPLASVWNGVPTVLFELSERFQRYLPTGGDRVPLPTQFGSSSRVAGLWTPTDALAMRIRLPAGETGRFLWRATVYDEFELNGYQWSGDSREVRAAAGAPVLEGLGDEASTEGRRELTFVVRPESFYRTLVVSPEAPRRVSGESRVRAIGEAGYFAGIRLVEGVEQYEVTALVPLLGDDDPLGRTQNRLRAAGQDYPEAILERYLQVPEGALQEDSRRFLDEVLARAGDNPFDIARTMEQLLRSPRFTYSTDVRGLPCTGLGTVECFARFRQGYCEYYASTMAVLLREAGIPTRLATGFLPGERSGGVETIRLNQAHAWVEVYFPGFGWVEFDPTGGIPERAEPLPSGRPVTPDGASPSPSLGIVTPRPGEDEDPDGPSLRPGGVVPGDRPPSDSLPFISIAVLLMLTLAALVFATWQRGPRGPVSPEAAWRNLSRLAARLGFGPRPTQTVYEYADALGEMLPASRPELLTVARAKVEVAYGRRQLGDDRLHALREAQRRLRLGLWRLLLLRGGRRRGR
jgi:transglutaminase-like putative cysteine protease